MSVSPKAIASVTVQWAERGAGNILAEHGITAQMRDLKRVSIWDGSRTTSDELLSSVVDVQYAKDAINDPSVGTLKSAAAKVLASTPSQDAARLSRPGQVEAWVVDGAGTYHGFADHQASLSPEMSDLLQAAKDARRQITNNLQPADVRRLDH